MYNLVNCTWPLRGTEVVTNMHGGQVAGLMKGFVRRGVWRDKASSRADRAANAVRFPPFRSSFLCV